MATTPPKRRARSRRRRARTEWHPPFCALVEWRCPRWVRVTPEVLLQRQSQRIDLLLSLRARPARDPDDHGQVLRSLWRHIPRVALLEFKSVARAFAAGDLYRLVACGWHWLSRNPTLVPADVLLVLVLPCVTDTLRAELDALPLSLAPQEPEVAKNEPMLTKLAQSLPLRIPLEGLEPEERLADLPPEHTVLALPDSMLARLPESFLATLPADVQDAVRARLAR